MTPTGGTITTTLLALPYSALNYTEAGPVAPHGDHLQAAQSGPRAALLGAVRNLRNPSVI